MYLIQSSCDFFHFIRVRLFILGFFPDSCRWFWSYCYGFRIFIHMELGIHFQKIYPIRIFDWFLGFVHVPCSWLYCIDNKVGCVFLMVVVSMLPHPEIGRNDHRESAPHFILKQIWIVNEPYPLFTHNSVSSKISFSQSIFSFPSVVP